MKISRLWLRVFELMLSSLSGKLCWNGSSSSSESYCFSEDCSSVFVVAVEVDSLSDSVFLSESDRSASRFLLRTWSEFGESSRVCRRRSSSYGGMSAGSYLPSIRTESSFMNLSYFSKLSRSFGENNRGMRRSSCGVGEFGVWMVLHQRLM